MRKKVDISGMTKKEVKTLCNLEGYSTSTYYAILKRGWIIVEVE